MESKATRMNESLKPNYVLAAAVHELLSLARGRVGSVTDGEFRGLWFDPRRRLISSSVETISLSRVVSSGARPTLCTISLV